MPKLISIVLLSSFIVVICGNNGTHQRLKRQDQDSCGVNSQTSGLILGGSDFDPGTYPWMVALMTSGNVPQFFCGGVLVSSDKIVTAAHCIQNKKRNVRKRARDILLMLGVYDLNNLLQSGATARSPSQIFIHPDWNPFNIRYEADIAVILVDVPIPYTKFTRPICLPSTQQFESKGFVAGWGVASESLPRKHETIPKHIEVPITPIGDCIYEAPELFEISSKTLICGGSRDGKSPCFGDSGGGLVVKSGNKLFLRGIVSATLTKDGFCDVTSFALYTDVDKYLNWIQNPSEENYDPTASINKATQRPLTSVRATPTAPPVIKWTLPSEFVDPTISLTTNSISTQSAVCGLIPTPDDFLQNFSDVIPWAVPIQIAFEGKTYKSFGTLISDRHVAMSASSMTAVKDANYFPIAANNFKLYFGASDLDMDPSQIGAAKVKLHPEHKYGDYNYPNIGVLTLTSPVSFTRAVSPICIPTESDLRGRSAVVVGWDVKLESITYDAVIIEDIKKCSDWSSHKILDSRRFFCAEILQARSVCLKDQALYENVRGRWMLRGLKYFDKEECNSNDEIYEDVGQYHNWLTFDL